MRSLRELIEGRAEKLGVELGEKDIESVLKDLLRWKVGKSEKDKLIKTKDGSYTLWSGVYGEPYHSITAGAVREALEKFVVPSRVVDTAGKRKRIRILDVGFGLGYNVAVALSRIKEDNPGAEVEVISLEKDVREDIPLLPKPYRSWHKLVLDLLPCGDKEGVSLKLLLGDARGNIKELAGFGADAVFHDPFSPYRNPEMWSVDFLDKVKQAMSRNGYWVSYTSALPVRKALLELGFKVGSSRPVGRKRGGTVATLSGRVSPLSSEEGEKLLTSPFSIPFRDPNLRGNSLEILVDYRLSVLLRERELSSRRTGRTRTGLPSGGQLSGSR